MGVIEKDYVLGWLLAGISQESQLSATWIFKGGTCLRKCYYETYRFSEDLDFTVIGGGPETPEDLVPIFRRIAIWLREESGIDLVVDDVLAVLARKCAYAGIDVPTVEVIRSSPFRGEIEREWKSMLGHQLPQPLPPFSVFWNVIDEVFSWLAGEAIVRVPQKIESPSLDSTWIPPRAISSWRRGFPLELIRYAGANRLKVDIDYRAENGRQRSRRVESYSLRRTNDGELLLFVVNDRAQLRGYRVDRIVGVKPTDESFEARFAVEF